MDSSSTSPCKPQRKGGLSCRFGTIVGLQFLTEAAFGFMSPIISIVMTEYFARLHRDGLPIDCGAHPHDEACTQGSREAAWLYSLFASLGSVFNFILAPMLGQASDVYGRKPFLVLSQLARVGTPFSIMYFMQPGGSIIPYLVLRMIDYGFGTAGVMSAAVADIVSPGNRAAAFGILFASISVGYCMSAFIAPFFSREHILQITAVLFVARVLWAMFVLPETLPIREHANKTRWVVETPVSAMSILFRNKLFMRLTCIIALTSFAKTGVFQIQAFYLNTIVGFDVKDFGNLMLLGGVLSLLGQGLLLKPLVGCFKEKGVIIIALLACFVKMCGLAGTAFYPHKWVAYAANLPGTFCDLSFPAISALKSINVSEKEQGRLQGAIYGARSVFDALGPVVFSSLYASMTRQSVWSQALPFIVAACIYFVGVAVGLSLPVMGISSPSKIAAVPAPLPSPKCGESPSSSSMYFETDDDDKEDIEADDGMIYASSSVLDDDQFLAEPLLGSNSSPTHVHADV
ncbi:Hippocampus abundant transcript-like protein 1 [Phytophthora ramorum]|uniref:Hippocampus abundant transcript-like protein 1 n=1 Tax=Phytophthora ramorum TaxID=164328 RepID=UPI0030A16C3F|nr:Hippocampus abundant transcript-like protein 1 [Phytophthora ramorum]